LEKSGNIFKVNHFHYNNFFSKIGHHKFLATVVELFTSLTVFRKIQGSVDLQYAAARAHNRAMADFCSADKRMIAVGFVPLVDAERALVEAREAIKLGCGAILVPSAPPKDKSPTHPDFHPLWALLQETGVPFVTHVGGGGRSLRPAFHKNGKPPTTDLHGGGENIRSKDYMSLHFAPEIFVACMVLDGIFEQFPGLRGGCIEQGAMWVIPLLKRLDLAQDSFQKNEPALRLPMKASEYVRRQLKFTPFPNEDAGWMIEQGGEELLLFSTDYPHPEGTRDPFNRFESSLSEISESAKERFYSRNFAEMMRLSA